MSPEPTPQEIQQLNLDALIKAGRQAIAQQNWPRAAVLLREAVRRAPFRQELREMLGVAIEGGIIEEGPRAGNPPPAPARPAPARLASPPPRERSPLPRRAPEPPPEPEADDEAEEDYYDEEAREAPAPAGPAARDPRVRERRPAAPIEEDELPLDEELTDEAEDYREAPRERMRREVPPAAGGPFRIERRVPGPQTPTPQAQAGQRGNVFGSRSAQQPAARSEPARNEPTSAMRSEAAAAMRTPFGGRASRRDVKRAQSYASRHRRGPVSALLMGVVVGLLLMGILLGGGWLYYRHLSSGVAGEKMRSQARTNEIKARANEFKQRGAMTQALEQIGQLPAGPERNQLLAQTYMEIGDRSLAMVPPRRDAALEAYQAAVKNDDSNPQYGNALGRVYYQLAGERGPDTAEGKNFLTLARDTFSAVLDRDSANIEALSNLAKVAIRLRDDKLQADCYRRIIRAAPNSDAARDAKRDLQSLGFRLE